jgi:endonuclease-3
MRVTKRLGIADISDNEIDIENKLYKCVPKERLLRTHQQLILFGRYKCKAIKPECKDCKLIDICKYEKKTI